LNSVAPASSDASFRRYFRVNSTQNGQKSTFIVMDAPTDKEDSKPFIKVAKLFHEAGLHVPNILESDLNLGFLLLSDLGNTTYLSELNAQTANGLYQDASSALIKLQLASQPEILPNYDEALLVREMALFPEWYLEKHLNFKLNDAQKKSWEQIVKLIVENNLSQAQTYVHRDYHCRNLMVTQTNNPGVLDFQDAVYGPITYDLVSLWRDAYIEWDEEQQIDWLIRYWEGARKVGLPVPTDFGEFYRDFEWMGLQRHLKVLGIFARLYHRDGKDGYLKDLPLVLRYVEKVAGRYIAFKPLVRILDAAHQVVRPDGLTF
jgi:aminoglycoside/choline kinase family phosphotransferase